MTIIDGQCRLFKLAGKPHCAHCLTHPEWRTERGIEYCPHQVTLESLPLKSAKVVVRKKGCFSCKPQVVGGE